ncbi:MAG TPA: SAP domain-containing protein [Kofleriaceae bacterium]|jgi:hypothetical protein
MRLTELLADLPHDTLVRLAKDDAHAEEVLGDAQLRATIESVLRSHRFLQDFIFNRQPPTFAILALLLEAEGYSLARSDLPSLVQAETTRICVAVDGGLIVGRDDQLRVYRRVLHQARSNDYQIDNIEASILMVLREELNITQTEHFLIEHHSDLREFWRTPGLFEREFDALVAAGVIFARDGRALLPIDQVGVVRRVIGLDMSRDDAKRLYGYLSSGELHDALAAVALPTSGNKDDRIARLISNMVQPRAVLLMRHIGIERLKELCRDLGAAVSGAKEDLVGRLIEYIGANKDLAEDPAPLSTIVEERALDRERFGLLFDCLRAHDLTSLLVEFELRRSGTKETQIQTLWDAARSETSLLQGLASADLEQLLRRAGLKTNGSKSERIARVIANFASTSSL